MNLVVIKYNAGNIQSVKYALARLGIEANWSDDPETIRAADKVIFPGVGEASTAMDHLRKTGLDQLIPDLKQPTLGICLGQQLMCRYSEENDTECLGIFDQEVKRFGTQSGESRLKVPQIGWNALENVKGPLMKGLNAGDFAYFVHSYYVEIGSNTIAETQYGVRFSAALNRDNFYATQFHPEKSAETGAQILENFIRL